MSTYWILILLSTLLHIVHPSTIAIDFGSEFITTSVIASRKPISLVENPHSKTKTNQYLSITNQERVFGYDAIAKIKKNPTTVFHHMQRFLSQLVSSSSLQNYISDYFQTYDIVENKDTHQIQFKVKYNNKDYLLTSEEIIAMMLKYIKSYAEKFSKSEVNDCVITIPCFYTYKQREALQKAVELTGMRLLRLVHDNTAAAVKYFNDNRFQKEEKYYIFYNMGDSFIQVSLVSVHSLYQGTKKDMEERQHITIIDEAYDKNLGGRNFDYILAKLIYKKYMKETYNKEISESDIERETIQRILPSAIKYKEMLSANKEINIKIIGIEKGGIYEGFLTRDEFISAAQSEIDKVHLPLMEVLSRNDITIDKIEQIELIGGGHRIPAIRQKIADNVPESKIGVHLNGDDVIAFGAGIIASNALGLVNSYGSMRKKITLINNGHNFDIKIKIRNRDIKENEQFCDEEKKEFALDCVRKVNKNGTIFKRFYNFTEERSVSFNHDSDFIVDVYQSDKEEEKIMTYKVNNINAKLLQEIKKDNPTLKESFDDIKIKLIFSLDKLGMISMRGELVYKVETFYTMLKQKNKNGKIEFKYLSKKPTALTQEEIDSVIEEVDKSKDYSKNEKEKITKIMKSGDVNVKSKFETRKKIIPSSKMYITIEQVFPFTLDKEQIMKGKNVLKHFDDFEKKNLKFAEQKNLLESLLYNKKEWINNKELNAKYAKEDELNTFASIVKQIEEWYNNNGDDAKLESIEEKVKEIKTGFKVFNDRIEKEKKRNTSIKYFRSEVNSALKQGRNWISEKPWIENYYNNEFKSFTDELKNWIETLESQQSSIKEYEEPIITKKLLDDKISLLKEEVKKMKNIPRPVTSDL